MFSHEWHFSLLVADYQWDRHEKNKQSRLHESKKMNHFLIYHVDIDINLLK